MPSTIKQTRTPIKHNPPINYPPLGLPPDPHIRRWSREVWAMRQTNKTNLGESRNLVDDKKRNPPLSSSSPASSSFSSSFEAASSDGSLTCERKPPRLPSHSRLPRSSKLPSSLFLQGVLLLRDRLLLRGSLLTQGLQLLQGCVLTADTTTVLSLFIIRRMLFVWVFGISHNFGSCFSLRRSPSGGSVHNTEFRCPSSTDRWAQGGLTQGIVINAPT
jgi:hypothetical protein